MPADYGVIGVGSLAEAIVTGLSDGVENPPTIVLSPRGADRSARLAERFSDVTIAADNQSATDAEVVVICVRPDQVDEAMSDLTFRDDQHVVSVVAATTVDRIQRLAAPAASVARTIPMPEVARRAGVTPVCPPTPAAVELFERLGTVIEVTDESAFDAMSVATATVAAHLHYVATIAEWLTAQGLAADEAASFVAGVFNGLDIDVSHGLGDLTAAHATPGGFNEGFDRALTDAGVFDHVTHALDANLRRTRSGQPEHDD